ncbi:Transcriptional activator of proteases prtT [Colletotrichum orbiculare MAFF 240422]|uniref:Transcriptional activator of proteases prtT n=1 Tax=Colletotrichum orbiculare (strain 104-T / ATCC 96160 / CBS 514.97 / LARS 414 / MAFF 240422) TaxID=1213857 RepID=A0A484FII7_COLOR|nr:Transcriptional activator of proteases prtT [Colletotrichum orbiculare MAFF 240422]
MHKSTLFAVLALEASLVCADFCSQAIHPASRKSDTGFNFVTKGEAWEWQSRDLDVVTTISSVNGGCQIRQGGGGVGAGDFAATVCLDFDGNYACWQTPENNQVCDVVFEQNEAPIDVCKNIGNVWGKIKACAACRKHKIKCLMDESGPPCRRCAERNLGCVLGKSLQSIIDEKTQYNEAVLQDIETLHHTLREVSRKVGLPEPPGLQSTCLKKTGESPPQQVRRSSTANSNSNGHRLGVPRNDNHGPSCDNSPKISPEDENLPHVPIHSLYALTKLRALRSPDDAPEGHASSSTITASTIVDDFISRGALSLDDAERLFKLYRDRLDAFMYGVGCKYQHLEQLRRRSAILTAATLTVAALHDPQANGTYGVCSSELRRLTERSMFERRVDRDHLRAMCVASYWLSDVSWMLSGYAIRRAAESNLHNSYARAVEERSEEAADGARLWYILNICDQHLATLYGRPAIVHEDASMRQWERFLASPVSNEEDKRLASQVALLGIIGNIRELFGPDKGQPTPRAYVHQIAHFNKQLDHWIKHWSETLPEQSQHIGRFPRKGAMLHFHFAKLHLYSHVFRGLSGDNPIPHHFLDCAATAISVATSTVNFILTDPDVAAGVVGMPSYLHCMTAFASMFLIKVAVKYGGDLVEPHRVWDLTTSLVRHFRSLPAGRWHLANLMAPGLERMAATLKRDGHGVPGQTQESLQAVHGPGSTLDPQLAASSTDGTLLGPDGDIFFDYDMSFGLSPVFNFDTTSLNSNNASVAAPDFSHVDYHMATRPST